MPSQSDYQSGIRRAERGRMNRKLYVPEELVEFIRAYKLAELDGTSIPELSEMVDQLTAIIEAANLADPNQRAAVSNALQEQASNALAFLQASDLATSIAEPAPEPTREFLYDSEGYDAEGFDANGRHRSGTSRKDML